MGAELDKGTIELTFDGLKEVGETALELMAMDFWAESVQKSNIKEGTLRDSIQVEGEGNQWIVGTNLFYAPFVHDGTAPHDIYPIGIVSYLGSTVRSGAQALFWPGASHPVKMVHHPGYAGNPFFDDASDVVEGKIDDYIQTALEMIE